MVFKCSSRNGCVFGERWWCFGRVAGEPAHSFDDMTEGIKMVAIVYLQRSVLLSVANPLRSVCVCLLNDCHRCRSYSDVVGFVFPFIQRATRLMMTRGALELSIS